MDANEITNKITEYEQRIKALEAQVIKYQKELRDKTARTNAESNTPQPTVGLAEAQALRTQFELNYDTQMLQNIKDSFERNRAAKQPPAPEVIKYKKALGQVNKASEQHGLPKYSDVTTQ